MKLAIITAMWKRHGVFDIWAVALNEAIKRAPFDISVTVAGSEGRISKALVEGYGFEYVEVENAPLSNKFNAASRTAYHNHKPDYLLVLGSDNVICSRFLPAFENSMKLKADLIGQTDVYVIDMLSDKAVYYPGYTNYRTGEPVGSGRFFSRKVLNKMGGDLWPDGLHMSLDFHSLKKLNKEMPKHKQKIFSIDKLKVFQTGLKSNFDKNSFDHSAKGRIINKEITMKRHLSKKVIEMINRYRLGR